MKLIIKDDLLFDISNFQEDELEYIEEKLKTFRKEFSLYYKFNNNKVTILEQQHTLDEDSCGKIAHLINWELDCGVSSNFAGFTVTAEDGEIKLFSRTNSSPAREEEG